MLLELLRVKQYYKNLLVFLPLIFAGLLFNGNSILFVILAFISLCLISSTNYILNDIVDKNKDKLNPEKCQRPIASNKISTTTASIIAFILAILSLTLAIFLSTKLFLIILILFFLTQLYSLYFKNEVFLDIIFISTNFILRAIAGAYVLNVRISPWLILCTFFLSLFLVVGKRKSEIFLLKEKSKDYKPVLSLYSKEIINTLLTISTISLLISYSLYSFLSIYPHLIYTLPVSLYVILRYFYLIENNNPLARHPEYFYKDIRLLIGIIIWILLIILITY